MLHAFERRAAVISKQARFQSYSAQSSVRFAQFICHTVKISDTLRISASSQRYFPTHVQAHLPPDFIPPYARRRSDIWLAVQNLLQ